MVSFIFSVTEELIHSLSGFLCYWFYHFSTRQISKGVEGLARVGSRAALSFAFAFLRRAWRSGKDVLGLRVTTFCPLVAVMIVAIMVTKLCLRTVYSCIAPFYKLLKVNSLFRNSVF